MRSIGLIGGITWYSTLEYYRLINMEYNRKAGGMHSAPLIVYSVDFAPVKEMTEKLDWEGLSRLMCDAALKLEAAGADCLMIGANTMHHIADRVQAAVTIPLVHIAEAAASAINRQGLTTVALLGTKYTMQMDFYKDKLAQKGITTLIPDENDMLFINNSIYQEFSQGKFLPETRSRYLEIIDKLAEQGAQGVVMGCTEIPLLLKSADCRLPLFDTTLCHSLAAIDLILS